MLHTGHCGCAGVDLLCLVFSSIDRVPSRMKFFWGGGGGGKLQYYGACWPCETRSYTINCAACIVSM